MDLRQLQNFLTLSETLNFRIASGKANIVQPALSRQIRLLEAEVGALLFKRNKRVVKLTDAGVYFQAETRRILQDLGIVINRTAQLHSGEAGEIRITHASSAMNTVIPDFLVKVKKKWPGLKTIVHETSNHAQIDMLLTRRSDIGVAPNILVPTEIDTRNLYSENFALLLPEKHPLSRKKLTTLSGLKKENFILPQLSTGVGYVETILQICQSFGFKPKIAHESAHSTGVLRLVEAGLGVAIEPMSSVRGVKMQVRIIELTRIPQKVEMTLFWLREREGELSHFLQMFNLIER